MSIQPYLKTATAVVTGAIGWATLVVNSAPKAITGPEWIVLATFMATALGVFTVPNTPNPPANPRAN